MAIEDFRFKPEQDGHVRLSPDQAGQLLEERYADSAFIHSIELVDGEVRIDFDRKTMVAEIGDEIRATMEKFGDTEDEAIKRILIKGAETIPLIDAIQAELGCTYEEAVEHYFAGHTMSYPDGVPGKMWSFNHHGDARWDWSSRR